MIVRKVKSEPGQEKMEMSRPLYEGMKGDVWWSGCEQVRVGEGQGGGRKERNPNARMQFSNRKAKLNIFIPTIVHKNNYNLINNAVQKT